MAVGLTAPVALLPVPGVRLAACQAGMYRKDRLDLALMALDAQSTCAALFTRNQFCAAPVIVAKRHLRETSPRFLIINAGNANAGTGEQGIEDALRVCQSVADIAGCTLPAVLPFSTGVIGEYLPVDKMIEKIPGLFANLDADCWLPAVRAMMTTDTVAKGVSRQIVVGDSKITITGIAKGSGMIRPDMATLLAFIATDAAADQTTLDDILRNAVDTSFNRISVDGDTSTNDACVLVASGNSRVEVKKTADYYRVFEKAVTDVCVELAQAIIRDGEGATKFITIEIINGRDQQECLQAAYAIANSPLVKTACYASDPNWGRILAAVGRSGIQDLDISRVAIYLNQLCIVANGMRSPEYTEDAGQVILNQEAFSIRVNLGRGEAVETVWTCDLSHDYVKINAEYRT